jgi:exopolysaccharide biosynthesis polyprenyl glycosylphosphotransferase
MLMVADLLAALGIGLATTYGAGESLLWALIALPIGALAAKLLGLYDADHRAIRHLTLDEVPTLGAWAVVTTVAVMTLAPGLSLGLASTFVVLGATVSVALLRGLARYTWRRLTPREHTLVVGVGESADAIARKIELFGDMHLDLRRVESPEEHLDRRNGDEQAAMERALAGIDRVVLAWSEADPAFIERLLGHCRRLEVKLSVVSSFRGRARPALRLSQVADLPVLEYNTWDVPRSTAALKRGFDIVFATLALAVLSPVFAAVAIAIKLDDGGPVFFRQRRAGRGGKPFTIRKFRSMDVDAEQHLPRFVDVNALPDPMFKLRPDPRITRVGRFLRRSSLDEIPQLINVVRGEMSLVGPRPEEVQVAERYQAEHRFRLAVKPGVTGPMQVFGRGELSFDERMAVEIDYVENISITRDLWLLAQTVPAVVRGTGAF